MDVQRQLERSPLLAARQFSVRELLALTFVVSISLTIGVLAHGSERFQAFATIWTAVSLVPIVAVLVAYRWRLLSARGMVVASVGGYVLALALPAMGDGAETTFGFMAAWVSFSGMQYLWTPEVHAVGFFTITIHKSLPIACALGAAANLAYASAIVGCWLGRRRPRALRFGRRWAIAAVIFAISSLVVLCLNSGPDTFYPGCGLWVASLLALAVGIGIAADAKTTSRASRTM